MLAMLFAILVNLMLNFFPLTGTEYADYDLCLEGSPKKGEEAEGKLFQSKIALACKREKKKRL